MNTPPRSLNAINNAYYPTEFQKVILNKSQNFVGRKFVFTAITKFLNHYKGGYFTIVGGPGSGKSAILAKYVTDNSHVIYYNAQIEGKNRPEEFLKTLIAKLIKYYPNVGKQYYSPANMIVLPENATQGSWFLSLLLQRISEQLEPNQQLIIAIDALNTIDITSQSPSSNFFYLPRYLPDKVYFLLTRRPFLREKSGLLIETPSQTLNLAEYPEENRDDVQMFIQHYLISMKSWLTTQNVTEQEFVAHLTDASENNFMYLSEILSALTEGFYPNLPNFIQTVHTTLLQIPQGLVSYYQSHWQKINSCGLSDIERNILRILTQQTANHSNREVSVENIAQLINEDEFDVEGKLENWLEFLQTENSKDKIYYSLYHSNFSHWLSLQLY